jgi:hypothetical protein
VLKEVDKVIAKSHKGDVVIDRAELAGSNDVRLEDIKSGLTL